MKPKLLFRSSLALLAAAALCHAKEKPVKVFILSGQSNMRGLDPALSFTPAVAAELGEDRVVVVKDAQGGQPIRRWFKGWRDAQGQAPAKTGDLYDRLMAKVRPAIEGRELASVTFVWMQGERDAKLNSMTFTSGGK